MTPAQRVEPHDLPPEFRTSPAPAAPLPDSPSSPEWERLLAEEVDRLLAAGRSALYDELHARFERVLFERALAHTGRRRAEAAARLGVGRNTLTRKLKR
jgi:two-component system nitrogen regulation response regulator GlnG